MIHTVSNRTPATIGTHEIVTFGPMHTAAKPPGLVPQVHALPLREATGIAFDGPIQGPPYGGCDRPDSSCRSLPGPTGFSTHLQSRSPLWYSQVEYDETRQSVQIGGQNPGTDGGQTPGQISGPGFIRVIQGPKQQPGNGHGVIIGQPSGGGNPPPIVNPPVQGAIDPSQLLADLAAAGGGITQPDTASGYMQGQALPGTSSGNPALAVIVIAALIVAIYFIWKNHKHIEESLHMHEAGGGA